MEIRALEPEDLPALAELCARPEVAAELDEVPGEKQLQTSPGLNAAIGAFENGKLVGAAGMTALARPRQRHAATAWLIARGAPMVGQRLTGTLRDIAFDWWHLDRLELTMPVWSIERDSLSYGFDVEVRREKDFARGGTFEPTFTYALVREAVRAEPIARPFLRVVGAPPPTSVELRAARPEDAPGFARVLADPGVLWGTLQVPFTPNALWTKRLASNEPSTNKVFVAVVDGEIVGTCGLHRAMSPRRQHVWSLGMSIRDAWQGRGLGKRMMQHLVDTAEAMQVVRLELDVYTDNTRAIALYEQFGFVREGVKRLEAWRDGSYSDALVMARVR